MSDVAAIPIELLVAGRTLSDPALSPNGSHVAFVQRWRAASSIVLVPTDGGPERLVTAGPDPSPGRGMSGGCFAWMPDGSGVVYVAVDGELWQQPLSGAARQLTSLGRSCKAPQVSADGRLVAFAVDEAEVWTILLGDSSPLVAGGGPVRLDDGRDAFCFDPVVDPSCATVTWQAWSPPSMPWDDAALVTVDVEAPGEVTRWRPDDAAVQQPRFLPDGTSMCVHDATGWLQVYVGETPLLDEPFEHALPTWGMGQRSFVPSPDGTKVALCRNETGFGRLCVVHLPTRSIIEVGRGGHGQLSWRGDHIVALRTGAVTPDQIVRYDASALFSAEGVPGRKPERTVLAVGPAAGWSAYDLPEPALVRAEHDSVTLHARHYRAGNGRLLCWVHGGPTDQWQADFRPRISYWWSRGWDVLVVDPRGTTGHGRAYQRALNAGWGRIDVDDTAALLRHAQQQGWATPATSVVIGGSSGGLTVLGVLADHPDLIAGGVASYPVSDLAALSEATHRFEAHYTDTLVGPADGSPESVERFRALSPLFRAERITSPLLVFHGTDDPVVPIAHSRALADAVRSAGGSVVLVEYEGEGHGVRAPENVRDEYQRTERFLDAIAADAGDALG